MQTISRSTILCVALLLSPIAVLSQQNNLPVSFTKLSGLTGGFPTATAIYRAELTGLPLTKIQSITINDHSSGLGGAEGRFSGFDLDAIKLSNISVGSATSAQALTGLNVFDFTPSGITFSPGSQRAPFDPALFGTVGGRVDNNVATLQQFDANSTLGPTAFGFVSLGDNGIITFNLNSPVSVGNLFLYIGEVGDNGEVSAGSITVSDVRSVVPEPGSLAILAGIGIAGALTFHRRRK